MNQKTEQKAKQKPRNPTGKGGKRITSENAALMAKKSHMARSAKKLKIATMKEWAIAHRDLPVSADSDVTKGEAVIRAVYAKAINEGDVRAAQFIADLMGETENRISLKEIPKLIDDI